MEERQSPMEAKTRGLNCKSLVCHTQRLEVYLVVSRMYFQSLLCGAVLQDITRAYTAASGAAYLSQPSTLMKKNWSG